MQPDFKFQLGNPRSQHFSVLDHIFGTATSCLPRMGEANLTPHSSAMLFPTFPVPLPIPAAGTAPAPSCLRTGHLHARRSPALALQGAPQANSGRDGSRHPLGFSQPFGPQLPLEQTQGRKRKRQQSTEQPETQLRSCIPRCRELHSAFSTHTGRWQRGADFQKSLCP